MIDEGAPWLESMRNARTKVATPVSRTVRSASGENGLLGFNLLPDSEPAPGFGRIGEYRLQLIEYWRRTQRADGTRPEAPAAVPAAAQKPVQPVAPPTVADGTPTRGTATRQKPAGPIQLPSSSLIRNGAAPATAPGSLLKTDAPAARTSSEPAEAPRQKHPNSLIESINEQMRAVARDVAPDPTGEAGEADPTPLPPVRDVLLDPIAPIEAREPLRSVTAAEEKPPAAAPAPAPLATEPTAAVTQVEPVPAAEPEPAAAEPPGKSGWTSAFRSAASSLPSMFASLTSKRQTTGLNLKEAMAGPPAPEARLESVAAEPVATEPVAEQPPEAAEVPDELPMEVAFEVPAMEEPAKLSVDEPEFLPTVDFLAEVSAPSIEPGAIGAYEVDPLQDDLVARLQEEAIDFSAPAQVTSSGDPGLSIPGDFEIAVEAPALPADWETSASGPGALRELSESLDMYAMASIGADAQFVDPDRVDTAGFDSEARSDAALEAIDASADGLSAAFSDESADSSVVFDMPGIAWEAVSDTAFSIGDVLADEAAEVTAATEAEVAPPLMPAKEPAVLHMPAPPPAPMPAPAAPAVALASSPAHVVNRESVSVRALEGFLKRIETRRRQVDKESVA